MEPVEKSASWADTWHALRSPAIQRLVIAAASILAACLELYRFVSPFAVAELDRKREELLGEATKRVNATLSKDRNDRANVDAKQNFELSQLQVQLKKAWEEHVRFVAATRKDDVDPIVKDFQTLCAEWPCPAGTVCMTPAAAADSALKQPRRRR